MPKIHVRPGQSVVDAFEESKHQQRMEAVSETATACAKAVEAARLDERERCAKIADRIRGTMTNGGAINACKAIAATIREARSSRS